MVLTRITPLTGTAWGQACDLCDSSSLRNVCGWYYLQRSGF